MSWYHVVCVQTKNPFDAVTYVEELVHEEIKEDPFVYGVLDVSTDVFMLNRYTNFRAVDTEEINKFFRDIITPRNEVVRRMKRILNKKTLADKDTRTLQFLATQLKCSYAGKEPFDFRKHEHYAFELKSPGVTRCTSVWDLGDREYAVIIAVW